LFPVARPPADASDLEAIRAALAGEEDAFGRLVDKYRDSIFNLAYRMTGNPADAEELSQEAFLRAYTGLADFRVGARFHPWLYTITLNLCRNHLRRRSLLRWVPLHAPAGREEEDGGAALDPPAPAANPEQALLDKEVDARLQRAIDALPVKYREVFLLRQSEGLSYEEIAEIAGLPLGTVEVRLFRARRRLLEALGGEAPGKRAK
jgi:RNA polymerase sigma-70 factor (ECF subfamily)